MVRVRKLALAIAAASALSSGAAHALGLGEVTLRSTLNQPLDAEIELLEARDIGSEELAPALASPEEFNKAGVDRQYFLSDLKFTPIIKPNGKSAIRVTSSKPVREPYLNFLVEVLWPSGRLLREYTLLLDPPLYSSQTAMSAAQTPLTEQKAGAVPRAPTATSRPTPPRPEASGTSAAKEYRTTARDTLWTVAERVRTSGTVHQTMLAIQDLNPDAFLDGNINRLLSGQVLRLPDEQQIRRRSESQALADVAAQNSAWRERRARPAVASSRQLDATRRSDADAVPARVETGDNLRLVAVNSGKAVAGSDKGGDGKASADKLALAKENLDATQRESIELKSRMDDLQGQLDKLQRLITLKDEQLAKLQTSLAQPDKVAGVAAGSAASTPPVVPGAPEPAAVTQPVAATVAPAPAPAAAGVASAAPTVPPVAPPETPSVQPAVAAAPAQAVAEPVATAAPAAQPVLPQPEPEPAKPAVSKPVRPAVEPEQPVGLVDSILGSPLLLPSLGGSVAAALLLGLLAARRRAAKQADLEKGDEEDALEADARPDTGLLRAAIDVSQTDEGPRTEPGWDALVEAEDHLAHGRLNQAAELLQAACKAEPKRSDLRLKLMEVQAALGDREGFAREEKVLRETAGAQQPQVDHLKMKYPAMAGFAAAALAGGALAVGLGALEEEENPSAATQELEPSSPLSEADIDLSLDDLEAELERDLQGAGQDDPFLSLDDLALDESSQPTVSALEPLAEDFSFDLELPEETDSFDLEDDLKGLALDLEAPVEPISAGDKDFLGLDLDALDAPAAARAEAVPSEVALLEEGLFDSFDLAANADFSDASAPLAPSLELPPADKLEEKAEADGFMSQLDELDVELEQLAAGLGGEVDEGKPAMHLLEALDALEEGEDFDFLADADEIATKLDLARAYIEMGDSEGARDILDEVLSEGSEAQRQEAREMSVSLA